MNLQNLKELIKKLVQEYTGTGASGGNATDGNDIPSPRPFDIDEDELENYLHKNVYGGEGGHYRKDKYTGNYPNRHKMPMFELKKYIKKMLKEQAYGSATLTTQGQYKSRFTKTGRPPGVMENRAQELADTYALWQLKQMRDDLMKDMENDPNVEPEGGETADQYGDQLNDIDQAIQIIQGVDDRFDKKYGPGGVPKSYDEVYLTSKLVDRDMYYEYEDGKITIYPDTTPGIGKTRSSQEIVFTKDKGEIYFLGAFGYEKSYFELEKVLPDLPEMGDSSYAGFMNVSADDKLLYSVSIDTAKEMIQAMRRGREAEARAQSAFYGSRGSTSGTIDESLNEQSDLENKAFQQGLKRLQKAVINYQIRHFRKQRSKAISAAAKAGQEAGKGFDDQIDALEDQIKAIDNPEQPVNEIFLVSQYLEKRQNSNLMEHMDSYKNNILLESTITKFFNMFDEGKSIDEVLQYYAQKGIKMPETFIKKIKTQYESFQKLKLEIEMAEQESKDYTIPKAPEITLFRTQDVEDEEPKQISSGILKQRIKEELENLKEKKYNTPPEILDALKNTLKINPINRFIDKLKAVNSIPPSYRIFLHNGQTFDLIYEEFSLMVKIGSKEYYLNDIDEKNYCIQHINRLLTGPINVPGTDEEGETTSPSSPPSPPPPPPPPADDVSEGEEPVFDAGYTPYDSYYPDSVSRGISDEY